MNANAITKKSGKKSKVSDTFDWASFDAMTDEEVHEAALADPDAQPLTEAQLARMKPVTRVKLLRMRLRLTQEQFARRYGIPLSTLRDWEQHRTEPDRAAQSYIITISAFPDLVAQALKNQRVKKPQSRKAKAKASA